MGNNPHLGKDFNQISTEMRKGKHRGKKKRGFHSEIPGRHEEIRGGSLLWRKKEGPSEQGGKTWKGKGKRGGHQLPAWREGQLCTLLTLWGGGKKGMRGEKKKAGEENDHVLGGEISKKLLLQGREGGGKKRGRETLPGRGGGWSCSTTGN